MKAVKNPIQKLAEATSLSTHKIARLTGISQPSISRHITEIQGISPKSCKLYAKAFKWIRESELKNWNKYLHEKQHTEIRNGDGQA